MKAFIFFLLLMPLYAEAAPLPELICAPEARVTFHSRWLRGSILKLEAAGLSWEMPWSGRETVVTGRQLRNERVRDFQTTEAAATDELLNVVPEETRYVVYKQAGQGKNPLASVIYVDQALLKSGEADGVVIAQQHQELEVTGATQTKVSVFHCRSR